MKISIYLLDHGRAMSATMENSKNTLPDVSLSEQDAAVDVQDDTKSIQIRGRAMSAPMENLENIPPNVSLSERTAAVYDQDDSQSLQNNASKRVRESRSTRQSSLNYQISPINSDESDADVSDTDPTFNELQTNKTGSRFCRKS
ncbi:unnamed protein product [Psylliodes chrysocephalus]|uniref:Uncharacterized protein n=1 Tax=Psylliodes chrysocephalus TaxID=3402493 RepID=A0A9P0CTP1_9CUCU|nr:unnamed protein product [Psylliodes chrysocephala]